jgi:molybdopterin-binding aldehyde dehydrogenase-like protein
VMDGVCPLSGVQLEQDASLEAEEDRLAQGYAAYYRDAVAADDTALNRKIPRDAFIGLLDRIGSLLIDESAQLATPAGPVRDFLAGNPLPIDMAPLLPDSFRAFCLALNSLKQWVANGSIAVDEVWVSFDAGTIVNTDRVRAQMEGSVIFGMSLAFYGAITMNGGAIEQDNFRGAGRIVRMGEAPRRITVDLVNSTAAPGGVGEPGVPPVAPAIANAIFALTGKRFRALPLSKSITV